MWGENLKNVSKFFGAKNFEELGKKAKRIAELKEKEAVLRKERYALEEEIGI